MPINLDFGRGSLAAGAGAMGLVAGQRSYQLQKQAIERQARRQNLNDSLNALSTVSNVASQWASPFINSAIRQNDAMFNSREAVRRTRMMNEYANDPNTIYTNVRGDSTRAQAGVSAYQDVVGKGVANLIKQGPAEQGSFQHPGVAGPVNYGGGSGRLSLPMVRQGISALVRSAESQATLRAGSLRSRQEQFQEGVIKEIDPTTGAETKWWISPDMSRITRLPSPGEDQSRDILKNRAVNVRYAHSAASSSGDSAYQNVYRETLDPVAAQAAWEKAFNNSIKSWKALNTEAGLTRQFDQENPDGSPKRISPPSGPVSPPEDEQVTPDGWVPKGQARPDQRLQQTSGLRPLGLHPDRNYVSDGPPFDHSRTDLVWGDEGRPQQPPPSLADEYKPRGLQVTGGLTPERQQAQILAREEDDRRSLIEVKRNLPQTAKTWNSPVYDKAIDNITGMKFQRTHTRYSPYSLGASGSKSRVENYNPFDKQTLKNTLDLIRYANEIEEKLLEGTPPQTLRNAGEEHRNLNRLRLESMDYIGNVLNQVGLSQARAKQEKDRGGSGALILEHGEPVKMPDHLAEEVVPGWIDRASEYLSGFVPDPSRIDRAPEKKWGWQVQEFLDSPLQSMREGVGHALGHPLDPAVSRLQLPWRGWHDSAGGPGTNLGGWGTISQ